jgi:hypothetical protein
MKASESNLWNVQVSFPNTHVRKSASSENTLTPTNTDKHPLDQPNRSQPGSTRTTATPSQLFLSDKRTPPAPAAPTSSQALESRCAPTAAPKILAREESLYNASGDGKCLSQIIIEEMEGHSKRCHRPDLRAKSKGVPKQNVHPKKQRWVNPKKPKVRPTI